MADSFVPDSFVPDEPAAAASAPAPVAASTDSFVPDAAPAEKQDSFVPDKSEDYMPKYTRLQEEDLQEMGKKFGVNSEDIRAAAPWYSVPVELRPGESEMKQVAKLTASGIAGDVGAEIPGWLYKKTQDPKMRAVIDNLNAIRERNETAEEPGQLPYEAQFRKGMHIYTSQLPVIAAAASGIGPAAGLSEAGPVVSNLARAGKALYGVGKSAAVGAALGGASSVAQTREGEELPALASGLEAGAKFGGALGLAGEAAGFGSNLLKNKALNNTEERMAAEISPAERMNIEKGAGDIAQKTANSEKILQDTIVGDKTDLTPEEARTVAEEQKGPDVVAQYMDPNTTEGHTVRQQISENPTEYGNMPTEDAITKYLADDVVEERYKDLADEVSEKRPATLEEAQAAVENYGKGEGGAEQIQNRYEDMVRSQQRNQFLEESGSKNYEQPGIVGKTANWFSASGPMFRYYGEKFGLPLEQVHTSLNQAVNRMSYFTSKLNKLGSAVLDRARKFGVAQDIRNPEGGKIFQALQEGGDISKLSDKELQTAKDIGSYFHIGLQEANGLSRESGIDVTPMSIRARDGYLPVMTLQSSEALPRIQNALEKVTEQTGIKSLADLSPADFEALRKNNPLADQLADVAQMYSDRELQTPRDYADSIDQLINKRGGANTYETQANAAIQRTGGEIPDLIREKNIARMMNRWNQNTARHLYLRRPVDQLLKMADTMDTAGGKYEAQYVRNNIQDLMGVRQGTVGEATRWARTSLTRTMDKLIDKAGPNSPLSTPFKMAKGIPMVLDYAGGAVVNNKFFLNTKNYIQHQIIPFTSIAPYLGGTYGYRAVWRAIPRALANMRQYMALAAERGHMPSALGRNLETAFEGAFDSELARRGVQVTDAINRIGLIPMHIAVDSSRAINIAVGEVLAEDLAARDPGAMGSLRSFSTQLRSQILPNLDKPGVTSRLISDNLNSAAIMHFNKASMSEFGRVMGPMFSTFTRLPTQAWGEALYDIRAEKPLQGAWKVANRLLVPHVLLWGAQKALVGNPEDMSDRQKLLLGQQGIAGMGVGSHLEHMVTGGVTRPPIVGVAKSLIAPLGAKDRDDLRDKLDRAADETYNIYGPMSGLDNFLLQAMPTLITGHAPEGQTQQEKRMEGLRTLRQKLGR